MVAQHQLTITSHRKAQSTAHVSESDFASEYGFSVFCRFAAVKETLNLPRRVILVPFIELALGTGQTTVLYPKKHIASPNPCNFLVPPPLQLLPLFQRGLYPLPLSYFFFY